MKLSCWRFAVVMLAAPLLLRAWVPQPTDMWPDGSLPLVLDLASTAPNTFSDWTGAANEAIATWNGYLQRIQLTTVAPTVPPWYSNGYNELFFDSKIYGQPFPNGVLAVTYTSTDGDQRVESDIVFNSGVIWSVYHGPVQVTPMDFRRVAMHELGHVLGLDHPDEAGQSVPALMNSTVSDIETPTADDQAGIHALYDRDSKAPPVVLKQPSAVTVKQGSAATFTVEVGGRGPFGYSWRHESTVLADATDATLQIAATSLMDGGNYTVAVANHAAATTSQSALLTVQPIVPPSLVDVTTTMSATVTAGNDYNLQPAGLVVGDYPAQFEWKRNGVSLGVGTNPDLPLQDLQFSDAGDYTVTETNAGGSVTTKPFHLAVVPGVPPQILADLPSGAYLVGSYVSITANVVGSDPLTLVWRKNGVPLPSVGRSIYLTFPNFQATDAGTYTLTIGNRFGSATSSAAVISVDNTPAQLPLITTQPAAAAMFAGFPVGLVVTAEGKNLAYQWFKDGVPITPPPVAPGLPPPTAGPVLTLNSVGAADAGVYTVRVSNSAGAVTSDGARVTVVPVPAPEIAGQPVDQTVAPDATVTLAAYAASVFGSRSLPPLQESFTYQWYKDGAALSGQTSYALTLSNVKATDAGHYFARIAAPSGLTTDTKTMALTVSSSAPTLIVEQPGDEFLDSGDPESLRLDSVALEVLARRASHNATASLNYVTASGPAIGGVSPGTYQIEATNGTVTETGAPFTIGFLPAFAPVLIIQPGGSAADVGQRVLLTAEPLGFAEMSYQWTKDGAALPGATSNNYFIPSYTADQAGTYRVTVTDSAGTATSEPAVVRTRPAADPVISSSPIAETVNEGGIVDLQVAASGGTLHYQWLKDGQSIPNATNDQLSFSAGVSSAGIYSVVVSNGSRSVSTAPAVLKVIPNQRPPTIVDAPQDQTAPQGGDVTLVVGADGGPLPDHYQWQKDGVDIPGANDTELRLHHVQATDSGRYTVTAYNANGSATSAAATLTVDTRGRLANLSTRALVGTGDNVLVTGFYINGSEPRSVLVRGIGDQLRDLGVTGVLRDPYLQVFDANQKVVASDDDWDDGSPTDATRNARVAALISAAHDAGAFPLRSGSKDAALIATLPPGSYTAQVSGVVNTTGVGLVEVYELGVPAATQLSNLSCRSYVGTDSQIVISGVVVAGSAPRRLLVRAVGPTLAGFMVANTLADPKLQVVHAGNVVVSNDNWGDQPNAADIARAATGVGAFPLPPGSKDAAVLYDFPAGDYSVEVSGVGGGTGVALVEIYEITNP